MPARLARVGGFRRDGVTIGRHGPLVDAGVGVWDAAVAITAGGEVGCL